MWLWEIPIHQTTKNDEQWWTMHLLGTTRHLSLLGFYQMTGTFARKIQPAGGVRQPKTTTTKAVPLPAAFCSLFSKFPQLPFDVLPGKSDNPTSCIMHFWRFTSYNKKHEKGWNDALVKGCFQGIYSQEYGKSWGESDQGRLRKCHPSWKILTFQTGCVPSKIRGFTCATETWKNNGKMCWNIGMDMFVQRQCTAAENETCKQRRINQVEQWWEHKSTGENPLARALLPTDVSTLAAVAFCSGSTMWESCRTMHHKRIYRDNTYTCR